MAPQRKRERESERERQRHRERERERGPPGAHVLRGVPQYKT
jgi:hypothetical protein